MTSFAIINDGRWSMGHLSSAHRKKKKSKLVISKLHFTKHTTCKISRLLFPVSCRNTMNDIDAYRSLFLSLLEGFPCWANFGKPKTRINHDKNTFSLAITPLLFFFIITTLQSLPLFPLPYPCQCPERKDFYG